MKYFILIVSLTWFIASCKNHKKVEQKKTVTENVITLTDAQIKNSKIKAGKIEQRSFSSIIKVNGRIDVPPQNMVSVSVPLGGYLKSTKLLPGMHINKNEVIAVLDDQQYIQLQQDYLVAKAQFSFHESEYNRQKVLIRSLEEKLKLLRINPYNLTENTISKSIRIYSPIDGFVSKVNVNIGKYITPGDVMFELVNPTDIHLNLKIFEKDLDKLFIGQRLSAYTNNNPTKKYSGDIILISKDVAPDGTTEVHCHFDSYDKVLFPGMYMNAEIELRNNLRNVLPDEAVVH